MSKLVWQLYKPDSVPILVRAELGSQIGGDNLSLAFDCSQALAALSDFWSEHGLAFSKGLAVSPLILLSGLALRRRAPSRFRAQASLFAPLAFRRTAVSRYFFISRPRRKRMSGLSSPPPQIGVEAITRVAGLFIQYIIIFVNFQ